MARKSNPSSIIPVERIEQRILLIRDAKVLLSTDLAALYGVPVKRLNEAVARNRERFPADFLFQLSWPETRFLRSQFATLRSSEHFRYRPYAFTEQGIAMLSAVLRSPTAVAVSIEIVRVFVRLRQLLSSHEHIRQKLSELEQHLSAHDEQFAQVFDAIRQVMDDDDRQRRKPRIGYDTESKRKK